MPELGEETERHWEDYFVDRPVQRLSHVPLLPTLWVRAGGGGHQEVAQWDANHWDDEQTS